jgi:hypothetical protein
MSLSKILSGFEMGYISADIAEEQIRELINLVSVSNENLTIFGDGYDQAITDVFKALDL